MELTHKHKNLAHSFEICGLVWTMERKCIFVGQKDSVKLDLHSTNAVFLAATINALAEGCL